MPSEREEFITKQLGLVHACARRYIGRGIEYDDLCQAGCIGLIKAYDAFDSSRGIRFSTYAVPAILGEIRRLFRDGGTVKVSRSLKELSMRASRAAAEYRAAHGHEPRLHELAQILGVEPEMLAQAVTASQQPVSLTSEDDGADEQLDLPVEGFADSLTDSLALRQAIEQLPERDRQIITLRYFRLMTQSCTAQVLGMTQVQVSRREKAIIAHIREKLIS